MSIKTRVKQLEKQTGSSQAEIICMWQDGTEPDLFHGQGVNKGKEYRRGSASWPAGDNVTVIAIVEDR